MDYFLLGANNVQVESIDHLTDDVT